MTRIQARAKIMKTNRYLKKLLSEGNFTKHSMEDLDNMILYGKRKWKETFNPERAYN